MIFKTKSDKTRDWYLFNKPSEAGGRARRALARRTASEAR